MFGQDIEKYKQQAKQSFYSWAAKPKPPVKTQLWRLLRNTLLIIAATAILTAILFMAKVKPAKAEAYHGDRPARGWFWYDDPAPAPKEPKETKKPPQQPEEKEKPKEPEEVKKEFDFPVIADAPPVLRKFLKEPTEENAKEYLAWQYKYLEHLKKIGYNLRNAYIRFGGEVYPIAGYPEGPTASIYFLQERDNLIRNILLSNRDKIGIIYFYKTSCPECQAQKDILNIIINKYGLSIRGVSVDGEIDNSLPFPSVYNPSLIQQYGIEAVPTLLAVFDVYGQAKIVGLGVGLTSSSQIEGQLIRFMIQEGIIKEKDLNPLFQNFQKTGGIR